VSRIALGLAYRGQGWQGWQSQPGGRTIQDALQTALGQFLDTAPPNVVCAGRTDAGVHALQQVVHLDVAAQREPFSWVRGTNRFLPTDIAVQWALPVGQEFHARNSALGRRYRYTLRESPVRPALEAGLVGWSFRALDGAAMQVAAGALIGTHDFSAFRSSECQSPTPVKTLNRISIQRGGLYWHFGFDGNAFLHHMVRNIMGCLVMVGAGARPAAWMREVLASRSRAAAAPTFAPDGLVFLGPYYDARHGLPAAADLDDPTSAMLPL
jgi:tRNA pseudouridine38-40 synthase